MSDQSGGPGWWLASDGKWYPPQPNLTEPVPEPEAERRRWWKRPVQLWVVLVTALVCLALGAASAGSGDGSEVAAVDNDRAVTTTERTTTTAERTTTTTRKATTTTTRPPTTTTAAPTTTVPKPVETVSQQNARESAADYLDYAGFSRLGLIDQLLYEGYSQTDAAYAVDHIGADWMAEAAESARDYMVYSSFSRQTLVEQLLYEKFTQAEAEHGADSVGL